MKADSSESEVQADEAKEMIFSSRDEVVEQICKDLGALGEVTEIRGAISVVNYNWELDRVIVVVGGRLIKCFKKDGELKYMNQTGFTMKREGLDPRSAKASPTLAAADLLHKIYAEDIPIRGRRMMDRADTIQRTVTTLAFFAAAMAILLAALLFSNPWVVLFVVVPLAISGAVLVRLAAKAFIKTATDKVLSAPQLLKKYHDELLSIVHRRVLDMGNGEEYVGGLNVGLSRERLLHTGYYVHPVSDGPHILSIVFKFRDKDGRLRRDELSVREW